MNQPLDSGTAPRSAAEELNAARWGSAALVLLVLCAFAPAINNDFVSFDDATYVTANPQVQAGLTWASVKWAFTTPTASNWHPLTWLSHMLDCQVFGLHAWGHHLVSVVLHAANTLLVFIVFRRLTGALWQSWFLAALFGLHPLRVESVAWVAERKDVLSTFWFLITLWAYWRYATELRAVNRAPDAESRRAPARRGANSAAPFASAALRFYLLACLFFTLGLLSKQMLVTLPFVLLLLDVWPLRRFRLFGIGSLSGPATAPTSAATQPESPVPWTKLLLEKLPFFLLAVVFSLIVYLVQNRAGATGLMGQLPLLARVENALVSYARYLVKLFWPLDLAVFYPHPGYWPAAVLVASGLLVAALSAGAWQLRRTAPYLLVGWCWYVGTLLPVIGLVQVGRQSIADRYTYIPMIGISLALIWGLTSLARALRFPKPVPIIAATAAVVLCAALTVRQTGFWKNTETLFRHAIDAVPDNYLAHGNLADCLQLQGHLDEAFAEVSDALRLKADDINTRNSYGSVLLRLGRVEEAIGQFQEAIRRWPRFAEAHSNLAFAYQKQGRWNDALSEAQAAQKCNPGDFRLRVNLAALLLKLGRASEAIACLQQAVQLEPADASSRKDLAALLFNAGRLEEAAEQFAAAARFGPADAETEANLGICLSRLGRGQEAIPHLAEALRLRPNYPEAQGELQKLRQAVQP